MIRLAHFLFLLFLFLLPVAPEELGIRSNTLPDLSVIRSVLFVLLLAWVVGMIVDRQFARRVKASIGGNAVPIAIMAAFFGWRLVASALAPAGAATMLTAIRDMVYYFVPFMVAFVVVRNLRDINAVIVVVSLSACAASIFALLEVTTGSSVFALLTGVDSAWNTLLSPYSPKYGGALGPFPNPLAFGAYMVGPILLVSVAFLRSDVKAAARLLAVLVIVLCLAGIVVSTSRGALASLLAALVFGSFLYLLRTYRRVKNLQRPVALLALVVPFVIVVSVGALFAGYQLVQGTSDAQMTSSLMRVLQLRLSVPVMQERPLLGYGVGQAAIALGMLAVTVDNYYLTVALESGLVGLLFFLALVGYFSVASARAYLRTKNPYLLVLSMFFAAECTQLFVLSLKQSIPILYIGFALFLITNRLVPRAVPATPARRVSQPAVRVE